MLCGRAPIWNRLDPRLCPPKFVPPPAVLSDSALVCSRLSLEPPLEWAGPLTPGFIQLASSGLAGMGGVGGMGMGVVELIEFVEVLGSSIVDERSFGF
jgi:hypothetical protein